MAYKITTTDGRTFECGEVSHQIDGSVSIQVGGRKLRLASHYWRYDPSEHPGGGFAAFHDGHDRLRRVLALDRARGHGCAVARRRGVAVPGVEPEWAPN